ncbi:MAG: hypothetical protein L0099_03240, partial [Acidobacteria bacterium]|nr:hypothetical protein [Acidobacteriota bacterium]
MNDRIRRITEELWDLHEDLSPSSGAGPGKTSHSLERPVLSAFKAAVDHMRLVVWALIQAQPSRQPAEAPGELLSSVRAERVTEMLKALRADPGQRVISATPGVPLGDLGDSRYKHPKQRWKVYQAGSPTR